MYGTFITFSLLLFAAIGRAETDSFPDANSNEAIINSSGSSSSGSAQSKADAVTNSTVQSATQVKEDTSVPDKGREYKAGSAASQSNTGKGTAIATGSSLLASAIPMLMSIDPATQAAGSILMSQAGMEFAQAGADEDARKQNQDQRNMLLSTPEGSTGSQSTADEIKSQMNMPGLDEMLVQRGINPDEFKDQLASGQLTSPEAVRSALSDTNQYSEEALTAANTTATDALNEVLAKSGENHGVAGGSDASESKNGLPNTSEVGFNEGASSEGKSVKLEDPSGFRLTGSEDTSLSASLKSAAASAVMKFLPQSLDPMTLMTKIFGKRALTPLEQRLANYLRSVLKQAGILFPNPKSTIFHTAKRTYRSFGKWRKTYRTYAALQVTKVSP